MKSVTFHLGIVAIALAATYALVRYLGVTPELLKALPIAILVYFGVVCIRWGLKKEGDDQEQDG